MDVHFLKKYEYIIYIHRREKKFEFEIEKYKCVNKSSTQY